MAKTDCKRVATKKADKSRSKNDVRIAEEQRIAAKKKAAEDARISVNKRIAAEEELRERRRLKRNAKFVLCSVSDLSAPLTVTELIELHRRFQESAKILQNLWVRAQTSEIKVSRA